MIYIVLPFLDIHQCHHDDAPAPKSKLVKKFLENKKIQPGNSPDLNPIENAWNCMKNKVQEKHS